MELGDLITIDLIEFNVFASTKEEVLRKVATHLYKAGRVSDEEAYFQALVNRENATTTGFGKGIAIPHAKIEEVTLPTISVLKLNTPVEWDSLDDKPVNIVIALAVPSKAKGTIHLQLLAKLSEELMEDEFVEKLHKANSKDEIYQFITNVFHKE